MTSFIRVTQVGGPDHEFDVSVPEVEAHPDLYKVIDAEPVEVVRETTYVTAAKSGKSKTVEAVNPEPSVGDAEKEQN